MFDAQVVLNEFRFKAIRSSGAGGQHVNKTASKVELTFDLENSQAFTQQQKELLKTKLHSRLTKDAVLIMQCGESRSQFRNKAIVIKRCLEVLKTNLVKEKKRLPTKMTRAAKRKRLNSKRKHSEKKSNRKPPELD